MSRSEPVTAAECICTVLFQPEPEGGFTVTCPTLPGLVTCGETVEQALTAVTGQVAASSP
jgi:hypothetical protein